MLKFHHYFFLNFCTKRRNRNAQNMAESDFWEFFFFVKYAGNCRFCRFSFDFFLTVHICFLFYFLFYWHSIFIIGQVKYAMCLLEFKLIFQWKEIFHFSRIFFVWYGAFYYCFRSKEYAESVKHLTDGRKKNLIWKRDKMDKIFNCDS